MSIVKDEFSICDGLFILTSYIDGDSVTCTNYGQKARGKDVHVQSGAKVQGMHCK